MPFNEDRYILALTDGQLEDLVKKWLARLQSDYVGFERPTASADMGRDAVGFLSQYRYDGEWDNYQCKQLKAPLGTDEFVVELGKIFHYYCKGVHDGVVDRYHQLSTGPGYERLVGIMTEASKVTISGPLGKHNRVTVSVKQGACHHFANTGKLPWK